MTSAGMTIERLALHGSHPEPLVAGQRATRLLAGAELEPPELPPSALLFVRRLSDPVPGTMSLHRGASRPPRSWERAMSARLSDALRGAARPALGPVPAASESVLFADRAELLAALACDVSDGTASQRWWWRGMRRPGVPDAALVAEQWLESPERVPAALELLARAGAATATAALLRLPEAVCALLATRVVEAHGLVELGAAISAGARSAPTREFGDRQPRGSGGRDRPADVPGAGVAAPWSRVVPEVACTALGREHELLLGLSLVLRRAPALARSPGFAAATGSWLGGEEIVSPTRSWPSPSGGDAVLGAVGDARWLAPASDSHIADQQASGAASATPGAAPVRIPDARSAGGTNEGATPGAPTAVMPSPPLPATTSVGPAPSAAPRSSEPSPPGPPAAAPPGWPCSRSSGLASIARAARPNSARERRAAATPEAIWPPEPPPLEQVLDTGLGGAFYLLNLALYLGLYPDFTRPLDPGLALSPWDLVELLARRLGGSGADPLWGLLGRLAGRAPGSRAGAGFRPPRSWRVPLDWLEPFEPGGQWLWSAAGGELRIAHPAGFLVAALPCQRAGAPARLAREFRRVRPLAGAVHRAALPREPRDPVARWTARLATYTDARLRRALGLGGADDLAGVLLRRRARVYVTASHVDVSLRLTDLPLAVRYCGLDRDPGWIPAAGRTVALHFV